MTIRKLILASAMLLAVVAPALADPKDPRAVEKNAETIQIPSQHQIKAMAKRCLKIEDLGQRSKCNLNVKAIMFDVGQVKRFNDMTTRAIWNFIDNFGGPELDATQKD